MVLTAARAPVAATTNRTIVSSSSAHYGGGLRGNQSKSSLEHGASSGSGSNARKALGSSTSRTQGNAVFKHSQRGASSTTTVHPSTSAKIFSNTVRRSRSVTPVRHATPSAAMRNGVASSRKPIGPGPRGGGMWRQHQQMHKFMAKNNNAADNNVISARIGGNQAVIMPKLHAPQKNMKLSLRPSGSDTMLTSHLLASSDVMLQKPSAQQQQQTTKMMTRSGVAAADRQIVLDSALNGLKQSIAAEEHRQQQQQQQNRLPHNENDQNVLLGRVAANAPAAAAAVSRWCAYAEAAGHQPHFAHALRPSHSGGGDVDDHHMRVAVDKSSQQQQQHVVTHDDDDQGSDIAAADAEHVNDAAAVADENLSYCNCSDADDSSTDRSLAATKTNTVADPKIPTTVVTPVEAKNSEQPVASTTTARGSQRLVSFRAASPTYRMPPTPNRTLNSSSEKIINSNINSLLAPTVNQTTRSSRQHTLPAKNNIASQQQQSFFAPAPVEANQHHNFSELMQRAESLARERIFGAASAHHEEVMKLRALLDDLLNRIAIQNSTANEIVTKNASNEGNQIFSQPNSTVPAEQNQQHHQHQPHHHHQLEHHQHHQQHEHQQNQQHQLQHQPHHQHQHQQQHHQLQQQQHHAANLVASALPFIGSSQQQTPDKNNNFDAVAYMRMERELERLRCLIDIKDQQLERQQTALDRRQLVTTQTHEQHLQMDERLDQLEKHFEKQQQELQRSYQTHLLELEKSSTDLQRQLQQQQISQANIISPVHSPTVTASSSREVERLRYQYSELRVEYDAEVRTLRDDSQKLRLQLNDMKHQLEQHNAVGEEREKEWRRERKQLESDREALIEKLNQRVKQLSQLWNDHRNIQEQLKDLSTKLDGALHDNTRLEQENKTLMHDAQHFQRESTDAAHALDALRNTLDQTLHNERQQYAVVSKQAHESAVSLSNVEHERIKMHYEAHIRKLDETVREQRRVMQQQQQHIHQLTAARAASTPDKINTATTLEKSDAAMQLLQKQKSQRKKVRRALLHAQSSSSDVENEEENRNNEQLLRARSTDGLDAIGQTKRSNNFTSWRQLSTSQQQQPPHQTGGQNHRDSSSKIEVETFRHQYEQMRLALEQRALADQNALRNALLEEKTREVQAFNGELVVLKRQLRDAEEAQYSLQRRMEEEARHMRRVVDDMKTKYAGKTALVEELRTQIAQLNERLNVTEQEKEKQKSLLERRIDEQQKQFAEAARLLQQQEEDERKKQKQQTSNNNNDFENSTKQDRFTLRLAEQLQQMESRLANAESQANDWQQRLKTIHQAYVQVYGN